MRKIEKTLIGLDFVNTINILLEFSFYANFPIKNNVHDELKKYAEQ